MQSGKQNEQFILEVLMHFKIAIEVKMIIMGHIFIHTKFCVCGVEWTKFFFEYNKYYKLLSF